MGNSFKCREEVLSLQPMIPSKRFDVFPLTGGCSEGLDVCVFFPLILTNKFVGRTSRGHTGGLSHRISHPSSFCGACFSFSREKISAIPFPRRTVKSNFV